MYKVEQIYDIIKSEKIEFHHSALFDLGKSRTDPLLVYM